MLNTHRTVARAALIPVVGASILLGAGSASAHVSVSASSTAAGSSSILTFSVGHGCDGSATTRIAIQLPAEIVSVTPTRQPFYSVEKKMEKLSEPITDAHGNEITERVAQVVYTARTPLPEGQRDTFDLAVTLPEEKGETIAFPTIQTCEKGETAWTELAPDGTDGHDLETPAPSMRLTAAQTDDGHGHGDGDANGHGNDAAPSAGSGGSEDRGDNSALAISALVAGLLGLLAGGVALARTRK
ncbi:MAG TPA: YcnI family protein [Nocardioides sp.]